MNAGPRYAELAARALSSSTPEAAAPSSGDRAAAVEAIRLAMRAKVRRRWLVRSSSGVLAAAACMVAYFGYRAATQPRTLAHAAVTVTGETLSGEVMAVHDGREVPLSPGLSFVAGDRVVAKAQSRARLELSTGTKVLVEDGGDLAIVERGQAQVFALSVGAMRADVAKLTVGERFIVRTPDAEVEARGTSFRLARIPGGSCPQDIVTRLSVLEGVVSARALDHEDRIGAGQEWTAPCPVSSSAVVPPAALPIAEVAPTMPDPHAAASAQAPKLQSINDLFAEAMDAKRRGDKRQALATLVRLETQHPGSPLAESATVERLKILAILDPSAAATVARSYLAKYPDGFARSLAESILAKAP